MLKITYFDIRGRAEPIRLVLEEVGLAYEDHQLGSEEWRELKPKTPFGQLPSFRDGDLELYQSHAIFRHLARLHGLYGATEAEHTHCDVVCEAFRDAKDQLGFAPWRPDFAEQRAGFVDRELPERFAALEALFDQSPERATFWVGSALTIADVLAFAYLDDAEALFPGLLQKSEALAAFHARFAQRPRIAAYLASERRPRAVQYGPEGLIYPAD